MTNHTKFVCLIHHVNLSKLHNFIRSINCFENATFLIATDKKNITLDSMQNIADLAKLPATLAKADEVLRTNHIYFIDKLDIKIDENQSVFFRDERDNINQNDSLLKSCSDLFKDRLVVVCPHDSPQKVNELELLNKNGSMLIGYAEDNSLQSSKIKENNYFDIVLYDEVILDVIRKYFRSFDLPIEEKFDNHLDRLYLLKIYSLVRKKTRIELNYYKNSTLFRRIHRFISTYHQTNLKSYYYHMLNNEEEIVKLYKYILINVTDFFRDKEIFEYLKDEIVPKIVGNADNTIRIWIPACSTGEEAYSITMLFYDFITKNNINKNLQVFASDILSETISHARKGIYDKSIVNKVPSEFLKKYFFLENDKYTVIEEIKENILFAHQDILNDPPFSNIDFISCRNLLIYFKKIIQNKVLGILNYALKNNAILLLGNSETISDCKKYFGVINNQYKIFSKISDFDKNHFNWNLFYATSKNENLITQKTSENLSLDEIANRYIIERYAPPSVIIDENLDIIFIKGKTAKFLELPDGKTSYNIAKVIKPSLKIPVLNAIRKAQKTNKDFTHHNFQSKQKKHLPNLNISACPISYDNRKTDMIMVSFQEVQTITNNNPCYEMDKESYILELEQELFTSYNDLQATYTELETKNEELKSSNEEITSTNEELRSTNEELETSKEELQMVNKELITSNNLLNIKIEELEEMNEDINNLIHCTQIAVLFLDHQLRIHRFTPVLTEIIPLAEEDIGSILPQHMLDSLHDKIFVAIQNVLENSDIQELEISYKNRIFWTKILPYKTEKNDKHGVVITFVDISEKKAKEKELELFHNQLQKMVEVKTRESIEKERLLNSFFENLDGIAYRCKNDSNWTMLMMSAATLNITEYYPEYFINNKDIKFSDIIFAEDKKLVIDKVAAAVSQKKPFNVQYRIVTKSGEIKWVLDKGKLLPDSNGKEILEGIILDITDRVMAEKELQRAQQHLNTFINASPDMYYLKDADLRYQALNKQLSSYFKIPISEIIGKTDKEVTSPTIAKVFTETDKSAITTLHTHKSIEKIGNNYLGFVNIPIIENEKLIGVAGIVRDITEKIAKENIIIQNEKKYRAMFEMTPVGIAKVNLDFIIKEANQSYCKMLGYTITELLGKSLADITYPEDLEENIKKQSALFKGEIDSFVMEKRFCHKSGKVFWGLLYANLIRDNNGKPAYALGNVIDITERKRYFKKLLEQEKMFRSIYENTITAIAITDTQGIIKQVNSSFLKMIGYDEEEILNENFLDFTYPEDAAAEAEGISKASQSSKTDYRLEKRFIHKDGHLIWVDVSVSIVFKKNEPSFFVAMINDISDRKKIQESLELSEARQRNTLQNIKLAGLMLDDKGNIIFANKYLLNLTGYKWKEVIGNNWFKMFISPENFDEIQAMFDKTIAEQDLNNNHTNYILKKNGERITIRWSNISYLDPKTNRLYITSIGQDVTEQIANENRIKKALAEKEILLKEIHHRVKNNMQTISSLLFQQLNSSDDENVRKLLQENINRIHSMALIHEKIYQSENLMEINLSEYIRSFSRRLLETYKRSNQIIKTDLPLNNIFLAMDQCIPVALILNEIISNSLQHAFAENEEGKITISCEERDKKIKIKVKDNGVGLPDDIDLKTTETLGLYLIYNLSVRQLCGNLEVNNDNGTEFIIEFTKQER